MRRREKGACRRDDGGIRNRVSHGGARNYGKSRESSRFQFCLLSSSHYGLMLGTGLIQSNKTLRRDILTSIRRDKTLSPS